MEDGFLRLPELLKVSEVFELALKQVDDATDFAGRSLNEVADGYGLRRLDLLVKHFVAFILDGSSDPPCNRFLNFISWMLIKRSKLGLIFVGIMGVFYRVPCSNRLLPILLNITLG